MIRIADGLASLLAGITALCVTLVPAWFTHVAVRADLAPVWAYGPAALSCGLGAILGFAYLRKALRGIAPSRERRR